MNYLLDNHSIDTTRSARYSKESKENDNMHFGASSDNVGSAGPVRRYMNAAFSTAPMGSGNKLQDRIEQKVCGTYNIGLF